MNESVNLAGQISQSIARRQLFRRGQSILVAVSGGLDSMVLLHLLANAAPANRWRLTVAHFNHQLRGRSSDADERLVARAAQTLRLAFVAGRADVGEYARQQKVSIEMAARTLRHGFLARTASKRRIPAIALAHHADDQVELFFARLLRGAGGEGLAGMKWQSRSSADPKIVLVRPLLDQPKSALEVYARKERVAFREDASNAQLDFQRNRIRHKLLPLLKQHFQPALERVILRQMELVGAEADFVNAAANQWLTQIKKSANISPFAKGQGGHNGQPFEDLPVALQRRVLQLQLMRLDLSSNFDLIEYLRTHSNRPITANESTVLQRDASGRVTVPESGNRPFENGALAVKFESKRGKISFENTLISWKLQKAPHGTFRAPKPQVNCECFDADKLGSDIVLRHWHPGDRFQPIGMAAPIRLQDLFINQKVPRADRHQLLIGATASGEVFWVEGQRMGERFKLDKSTRYQLQWRWKRLL